MPRFATDFAAVTSRTIILAGAVAVPLALATAARGAITTSGNVGPAYDGSDPWNISGLSVANGGVLSVTAGSDVNVESFGYNSVINGTGSVTIDGAGSTFDAGFGLVVGDTSAGGTLTITNGATLTTQFARIGRMAGGSGTVNVGGGAGTSTWFADSSVELGVDGTGTLNINAGGLVNVVGFSGFNAPTGTINFNGGTLRVRSGAAIDENVNFLAGGALIDLPGANSAVTFDAVIGGAGGLTLTAGGPTRPLRLANANTYGGPTIVNSGLLLVQNTTGSGTGTGNITVNSGATFGGNGTASGAVTINAGGMLQVGSSTVGAATLTTGSIAFADASSKLVADMHFSLAGAADLLNVNGTATLGGGTLDLSVLSAPGDLLPRTVLLIQNDGVDPIVGTFGNLLHAPSIDVQVLYNYAGTDFFGRVGSGNDLAVQVTLIPEPASFALLAGAAGLAAVRRRRRL